jgi:hypothetical protein
VTPGIFEGPSGLVQVTGARDADLVDFSLLSSSDDALWSVKDRTVAVLNGPVNSEADTITFVVGDEVWVSDGDSGLGQVRCTYVMRNKGVLAEARAAWLSGGTKIRREGHVLDSAGHLAFGPFPVPANWVDRPGRGLESLLFGGGYLSLGQSSPESGFDLLLVPGVVRRAPIASSEAARVIGEGNLLEPFSAWGCTGWRSLDQVAFLAVFVDPLGYKWQAEYRRGKMDDKRWERVSAAMR